MLGPFRVVSREFSLCMFLLFQSTTSNQESGWIFLTMGPFGGIKPILCLILSHMIWVIWYDSYIAVINHSFNSWTSFLTFSAFEIISFTSGGMAASLFRIKASITLSKFQFLAISSNRASCGTRHVGHSRRNLIASSRQSAQKSSAD